MINRKVQHFSNSHLAFKYFLEAIEEGFIQKTRQTVVVSVWGARSYAALGIFGLNVQYGVHSCCTFPFAFVGGVERGCLLFNVDLYFKIKDRFNYFIC